MRRPIVPIFDPCERYSIVNKTHHLLTLVLAFRFAWGIVARELRMLLTATVEIAIRRVCPSAIVRLDMLRPPAIGHKGMGVVTMSRPDYWSLASMYQSSANSRGSGSGGVRHVITVGSHDLSFRRVLSMGAVHCTWCWAVRSHTSIDCPSRHSKEPEQCPSCLKPMHGQAPCPSSQVSCRHCGDRTHITPKCGRARRRDIPIEADREFVSSRGARPIRPNRNGDGRARDSSRGHLILVEHPSSDDERGNKNIQSSLKRVHRETRVARASASAGCWRSSSRVDPSPSTVINNIGVPPRDIGPSLSHQQSMPSSSQCDSAPATPAPKRIAVRGTLH